MFKVNENHTQMELFGLHDSLTKKQKKYFEDSIESYFYKNVFLAIDERSFSVLYSKKKSRPNVPVNQLVGSLILKHLNNWTYEELFKNLSFNILTRYSIGIREIGTDIFAEASIFNFQNKLLDHLTETGEDLLEKVFDSLTKVQLDKLGINTKIQRVDSFLIGSNIVDYNRLQLLVEVLKRFARVLSEQQRQAHKELFEPFDDKTSSQYIYRIKKTELEDQYQLLGNCYHHLITTLKEHYQDHNIFKILERVYVEHFAIVENKVIVIESKELHSGILMSPDDEQATFRNKERVDSSKGYVGHLCETADPENKTQLITDIALEPNNVDDATILNKRLPKMLEKTPDLDEMFTDGLYGSPANDLLLKDAGIQQYQTGIRGRPSLAGIKIEQEIQKDKSIIYWVSCKGNQKIKARQRKRWVAAFDGKICEKCPFAYQCNAHNAGRKNTQPDADRRYYFNEKNILRQKRFHSIRKLPKEKQTLRANVEATVRLASKGIRNGKVRVRQKLRVRFYLTLTCVAINLKRCCFFFKLLFIMLTTTINDHNSILRKSC